MSKKIHLRRLDSLLFFTSFILGCIPSLLLARPLNVEPEIISITGTLHKKVYPGLPNYEDIRSGDTPETVWVIFLEETNVANNNDRHPRGTAEAENNKQIQLILPEGHYDHFLNRTVVATGTMFKAHTIHHHTRMLMFVTKFQPY